MNLNGKVAVITGASSGIGKATAEIFAENKVNLVLAARRIDRLNEIKSSLEKYGVKILAVKTDVTNREEVSNLISNAKEEFGKIDILVNNAGIMPLSFFKNLHVEEWEQMIDVNIKGVLYGVAAVTPIMIEQNSGHIVNISSVAGRRVFAGGGVYCATKFAVNAITEGLRQELSKKHNIKVTSIEPGATKSELQDNISDMELKEKFDKRLDDVTYLEAEDIANSIIYACSQPKQANVTEILVHPTDGP